MRTRFRASTLLLMGALLSGAGCQTFDIVFRTVELSVKITDLAVAASDKTGRGPTPAPLPRKFGFPYLVLRRPVDGELAGDRCRVRVEPLRFADDAAWDGTPAPTYFEALPEAARTRLASDQTNATKAFAKGVGSSDRQVVGRRGTVGVDLGGKEAFVVTATVRAVNTTQGMLLGHYEMRAASDGHPVAELVVYGVSSKGGRDWMAHSAEALALGLQTFAGDHFACRSKPHAVYETPPAQP